MKKQQVVQVQQVVINKEHTSGFKKLLRTLSFLLLLVVFALFQMHLLFETQIEFILMDQLRPILQPAQDVIDSIDILNDGFYILSALTLALVLFTWTISKSVILKVLLTISILLSFVISLVETSLFISYINLAVPSILNDGLILIHPLIDQLLSLHDFVALLVIFITYVLLTILIAFRKPKRVSLSLVRIGVDIILLSLFVEFARVVLVDSFIPSNIYDYIKNYSLLIGYDFIAIGAIFGILGFYRN